MLSQKIRKNFLKYFKEKNHEVVPSSSTVPYSDPTLLFANAGMNQFKEVFLGTSKRDELSATSCQKCIRVGGKHNDLDQVGRTSRHMTFFEMLGNFSFGGYFKKEAIQFAWEVTTEVFQYDPSRLWVSVFKKDEEAFELWKTHLDEKRIIRLGEEDNFWSMGETGPCGPCSEILYDRGPSFHPASHPLEDPTGERYPEFWNLVFMEQDKRATGEVLPLPKPCIDTGAGLERIVSFSIGAKTVFQSDALFSLIERIEELSGKSYDLNTSPLTPAFHVVADHLRALAFAIADGAQPSNTERGYVLRKILRRCVRYGRFLGFQAPFLANIFPRLVETMGEEYRELKDSASQICDILTLEEEGFFRTLRRGGTLLNRVIQISEKSPQKQITGEDAFKLKDTYGFPFEEMRLIAKDHGLTIDETSYQALEEKARLRSRQSQPKHNTHVQRFLPEAFLQSIPSSTFVGYEAFEVVDAKVLGLIAEGGLVDTLEEGQSGSVILETTPFYPEKGGQVGDTGTLKTKEALFVVEDCQTPYSGYIVHQGALKKGALSVGSFVHAEIDLKRRKQVAKHHTATHLLHAALEKVLGSHVKQAGSLVAPNRLRFDFNHHKPLSKKEIRAVETHVNEKIWVALPVETKIIPFEEAQTRAEIKQFFGEKYGKMVRLVAIRDSSQELCGGTHVKNCAEIGYFRIIKEGSVAKGIRRIEGAIGQEAEQLRYVLEDQMDRMAQRLKATRLNIEESLHTLIQDAAQLKEQALLARKKALSQLADSLLAQVKKVRDISLISATVGVEKRELNILGEALMRQIQSGVFLLCSIDGDACHLFVQVSPDLVSKGVHANVLIAAIAPLVKGSGGGKQDRAQAGGKDPQGVPLAFAHIETILSNQTL